MPDPIHCEKCDEFTQPRADGTKQCPKCCPDPRGRTAPPAVSGTFASPAADTPAEPAAGETVTTEPADDPDEETGDA